MIPNLLLTLIVLFCFQTLAYSAISECNGDDVPVRIITINAGIVTGNCNNTDSTVYQITWEDANLSLKYFTKLGVYSIETGYRGASLIQIDKGVRQNLYYLKKIIVRSPPMNSLSTGGKASAEMQLYFEDPDSTGSNNIILSLFFIIGGSEDKISSFMSKFDPSLVGEVQEINFASTLKSDLSTITNISEYQKASYKSQVFTWLFVDTNLFINNGQLELFNAQWNDPFKLYKYDKLNPASTCSVSKTSRYLFCNYEAPLKPVLTIIMICMLILL